MELDKKLLDALEEISSFWALETVQRLIANIKRRKLVNTKTLLNSIDQQTKADLSRAVVSISFGFEDYGRYLDMKKNIFSKQPPIDEILDWIKEKGLQNFGPDPNPNKIIPKTTQRRMNEIAWGISRKKRRNIRQKRRPWFQSSFYKSLQALQDQLLLGVADQSLEEVKSMLLLRLKGKL